MIDGASPIKLDEVEKLVRASGGYGEQELLDWRSLDLVTLLQMLHFMTRLSPPSVHTESVRADAREMLRKVALDLG
jgi:hypothetical protein